jgi:hypothetical protein
MVAYCDVCHTFTNRFYLWNKLKKRGIVKYIKGTDYSSTFVSKDDGEKAL